MNYFYILLIAVFLDFVLGDPPTWPHPIRFIGWMIRRFENLIRKQRVINLKVGGFLLVLLSLSTVFIISTLLLLIAGLIHPMAKLVVSIYLIYTSLAAKCLAVEVKKVYKSLMDDDIKMSRKLLSYLVGRDTSELSKNEVTRAAIETVAENTVDGVLAPLFYFMVGILIGMPVELMVIYKVVNTLDSMVGYIQEPYKDIGYASAKLDDLANYIPARLGSLLMLIAGIFLGFSGKNGLRILIRDRRNHKSPNCGYPEAVAAGLLNIQLGGTNRYFGEILHKPTIGDDINKLEPNHIIRTINIMYGSQACMIIGFGLLFWLLQG